MIVHMYVCVPYLPSPVHHDEPSCCVPPPCCEPPPRSSDSHASAAAWRHRAGDMREDKQSKSILEEDKCRKPERPIYVGSNLEHIEMYTFTVSHIYVCTYVHTHINADTRARVRT